MRYVPRNAPQSTAATTDARIWIRYLVPSQTPSGHVCLSWRCAHPGLGQPTRAHLARPTRECSGYTGGHRIWSNPIGMANRRKWNQQKRTVNIKLGIQSLSRRNRSPTNSERLVGDCGIRLDESQWLPRGDGQGAGCDRRGVDSMGGLGSRAVT